ncbi:hypothetical protein AYI70_g7334 [Smittium culicis]|uniref:Uncharacterized protein n=1 Tax=Smittium culicis TaxID=133412 RepID=A0A1R1XL49_9FUNG|nr:hypothetical protein AYI70_g7334 [Smittium culicis]
MIHSISNNKWTGPKCKKISRQEYEQQAAADKSDQQKQSKKSKNKKKKAQVQEIAGLGEEGGSGSWECLPDRDFMAARALRLVEIVKLQIKSGSKGTSELGLDADEVSISELLVPPTDLADRLMQQMSMFANNELRDGSKQLNGAILEVESDILASKLSKLDEISSGSAVLASNGSGTIPHVGGLSNGLGYGGDDDEDLGDPV